MWTPTHVIVTVTKARHLLDKGKGGNDAYCIIGLGKEKFLTSVKPKTINPIWDEQAEFSLTEREELKVTIYHKSSLIDEFLGRAVINISELANDNINSHTQWYKLVGKPDKEHKKPEKDRGEIEIRVDFMIKPKSGSVADLSKTKDKSLSLKSLKDKSLNIKHSIGDKFKSLQRSGSKKSKYSAENQLADQSKRMGGSKIDFLDGDDYSSLTSSYSSINGPSLMRVASEIKQNRYSPRSSIISENSSINEATTSAVTSTSGRNDDIDDSISAKVVNSPSKSTAKTKTAPLSPPQQQQKEAAIDILPSKSEISSTSTPQTKMRSILKNNENTKREAPQPPPTVVQPQQEKSNRLHSTDSFASVFQASLNESLKETPSVQPKVKKEETSKKVFAPAVPTVQQKPPKPEETKKAANTSFSGSNGNKSFTYDEDIDWASSDEEIVNKQIATFERNQVLRNNSIRESKSKPEPVSIEPVNKALEIQLEEAFKSPVQFFHTDIDPFSSSSSNVSSKQASRKSSLHLKMSETKQSEIESKPQKDEDEAEEIQNIDFDRIDELLNTSQPFSDPFLNISFKNDETTIEQDDVNVVIKTPSTRSSSIASPQMSPVIVSRREIVTEKPSSPIPAQIEEEDSKVDSIAKQEDVELKIPVIETEFEPYTSETQDDEDEEEEENTQVEAEPEPEREQEREQESTSYNLDQQQQVTLKIPTIEISTSNNNISSNVFEDIFNNNGEELDFGGGEDEQKSEIKSVEQYHMEAFDIDIQHFQRSTTLTQSQRRRLMPTEDLTSDLNSDTDNLSRKGGRNTSVNSSQTKQRNNLQFNFGQQQQQKTLSNQQNTKQRRQRSDESEDDIKTPDIDIDFAFQEHTQKKGDQINKSPSIHTNRGGLPDILIQQKGKSNDKAKKFIDGLEGVPFSEITVPEPLRKQLEYFDREELLQLIAYQKKFIDYKESRIKDLDNYIDNLVVRVIETNPALLMQVGNRLAPKFK